MQLRFVAMVAHELRNPLMPLRMAAGLLDPPDPRHPASSDTVGNVIEAQVTRMTRLIDDLLDSSLLMSGKLRLECSRIDLIAVLQQAADTARPMMQARKQTLSTQLPTGPVWLNGDPVRLAQIMDNLLDNARKYTPEGGHIALTLTLEDGSAIIRVRDDGMGCRATCRPSSSSSPRMTVRSSMRTADWASGWRSSAPWWKATGGMWKPTAPAPGGQRVRCKAPAPARRFNRSAALRSASRAPTGPDFGQPECTRSFLRSSMLTPDEVRHASGSFRGLRHPAGTLMG